MKQISPIFVAETAHKDLFAIMRNSYQPETVPTLDDHLVEAANSGIYFVIYNGHHYIFKIAQVETDLVRQLFMTMQTEKVLFTVLQIDKIAEDLDSFDNTPPIEGGPVFYHFLSVARAADFAGITPRTLKSWYNKGLPYHKVNSRLTLIDEQDIVEFLKRFRVAKSPAVSKNDKVARLVAKTIKG